MPSLNDVEVAIEIRQQFPGFDLIIMKTNIADFGQADPKDYFSVSQFQSVVDGIQQLASAAQDYVVRRIGP
jgi:hypothetical protein